MESASSDDDLLEGEDGDGTVTEGEGFPTAAPSLGCRGIWLFTPRTCVSQVPLRMVAPVLLLVAVGALGIVALASQRLFAGDAVGAQERTLFPKPNVTIRVGGRRHYDEKCYFEYNGGDEDKCFCQLAGNTGCAGEHCVCPQGCGPDVVRRHHQTVTFKNRNKASSCGEPLALLTIPRSYFSHIRFLKTWCPQGMQEILETMLLDGYASYKAMTGHTSMMHCIHSATHVSTSWLHLHTFCEKGHVDHMPTNWRVAWCSAMKAESEAPLLAAKVTQWAEILYGPRRQGPPTNCSDMGCHEYGPKHRCSCNGRCLNFNDCCDDYKQQCQGEERKLRRPEYGKWPSSTARPWMLRSVPPAAILPQGQIVQVHTLPPPLPAPWHSRALAS